MTRNRLSTWMLSILLIVGGFTAATGVGFPLEMALLGILAVVAGISLLAGY